ncbi:MAG: xylulokinase [Chloroflexota bacterium]|nr:xylulokinase [Chloroflexota bacterium]
MQTRAAVLGIDVGTTAVKALLVGEDGHVLGEADAEQEVSVPRPAWAEQDPELWWASTRKAVGSALSRAPKVTIAAIGLSGQMHSSVFLDAQMRVIRPALLWCDGRTTPQRREIEKKLGLAGLRRTVGNLALEGFTAPKLLWLRDNEPRNYARLRHLLLAKDYIRYRLTGERAMDPSDASGTLMFDVRRRRWSDEFLVALELPREILPDVVGSAEVSGRVTPQVAAELGLPPGVPVVGGGADNAAGAVGSGVVRVGRLLSSIGTSGTLVTPLERASVDRRMRLHTMCHAVPDQWYLMGVILSAGNSLRWLRSVLLPNQTEGGYDLLTAEAEVVRPGADGLMFLPYLTGERTPHNDSSARGVFFGLHLGHARGHLARAVMEGVCFALRDSLELVRALGGSFQEVRAIGGGACSKLWRQMQADVFGAPVVTLGPASGPAYGAAIMAAVGAGWSRSIPEAADRWLRVQNTVAPDPGRVALYDGLYASYRALYPALKARFAEAAEAAAGDA